MLLTVQIAGVRKMQVIHCRIRRGLRGGALQRDCTVALPTCCSWSTCTPQFSGSTATR